MKYIIMIVFACLSVSMFGNGLESSFFNNLVDGKGNKIRIDRIDEILLFDQYVFKTTNYSISKHPFTGEFIFHEGIDYARGYNTPIFAPLKGKIIFNGSDPNYGNVLVLEHTDRIKTEYRHLKETLININKIVMPGDRIGSMGNSGLSTGPHLDFRVIIDNTYYNPEFFLYLIDYFGIEEIEIIKELLISDRKIRTIIDDNSLYNSKKVCSVEDCETIFRNNQLLTNNYDDNNSEYSFIYTSASKELIIDNEIMIDDKIDKILFHFGNPISIDNIIEEKEFGTKINYYFSNEDNQNRYLLNLFFFDGKLKRIEINESGI